MAYVVDRLLTLRKHVERLEAELESTDPSEQGPIRMQLEPAKRAESAAFDALVRAANLGDPEALVAFDVLQKESEKNG